MYDFGDIGDIKPSRENFVVEKFPLENKLLLKTKHVSFWTTRLIEELLVVIFHKHKLHFREQLLLVNIALPRRCVYEISSLNICQFDQYC